MHAEVLVLGVGSMGSAACYFLAKSGRKVIGLEQFDIPHEWGSHHGQSRIIRKAYFEHPDYVPLLERAYALWRELEVETGAPVFLRTGLLYMGKASHIALSGTRASASTWQIPLENLSAQDIHDRYPQVSLPAGYEGIFEPDAGLVTPERAVLLYTHLAIRAGARIHTKTSVTHWRRAGGRFEVSTNRGMFTADKLVICAGPYTRELVPALAPALQVTRQVVGWVTPKDPSAFTPERWPCWTLSEDDLPGIYYGFPVLDPGRFGGPLGFKLAHHAPGDPCEPHTVSRVPTAQDEAQLVAVLDRYFPGTYAGTHVLKTCLYTNTPDENFIIDFLPGYEGDVAIAAGFSGHGFKFASAVGAILSELITDGQSRSPIGFLSARRGALAGGTHP